MNKGTDLQLVALGHASARAGLEKLRREIELLESDVEDSFAADYVVNAFRTAWHLHAEIWDAIREFPELKARVLAYRGLDEKAVSDPSAFGAALAERFVSLNISRIIATSPKQVCVFLPSEMMVGVANHFASAGVAEKSSSSIAQKLSSFDPIVMIMGRPIVAARLLYEVEEYWTTLMDECGIEPC